MSRLAVLLALLTACVPPSPALFDAGHDDEVDAGQPPDAGSGLGRDAGDIVVEDAGLVAEVDAGAAGPCDGLFETACASSSACRVLHGVPEADFCAEQSTTPDVYGGCIDAATACDAVQVCATRRHGGDSLCFADACLPTDWAETPTCALSQTCPGGGTEIPVGQLCVTGELVVGGRARFTLRPQGCFASSCAITTDAACTVAPADGGIVVVDARICLGFDGSAGSCTPDCGGGGTPACDSAPLTAGDFTARSGELAVSFTVPSTLPVGGTCAGDPLAP